MWQKARVFILICMALVGFDQLTKALIVHYLPAGGIPVIDGFLNLVLVYNKGAAFGFLNWLQGGRWLLVAISILALGMCVVLALGPWGKNRAALYCLALICGGAVGNLVDRLRLGWVVDFVQVYWGQWYFPAFNAADAGITVGGAVLAWLLLRGKL